MKVVLNVLLSGLFRLLFYKAPRFIYSEEEKRDFDRIYDQALQSGGTIHYDSKFPKYRFVQYISDTKNVLLHGSNNCSIDEFIPRKQTLFNGQMIQAVFATKDAIWSSFYAVLDRNKVASNFRNGSLRVGDSKSQFHYYSVDTSTSQRVPWTSGMIYFLPGDTFKHSNTYTNNHSIIHFDEWVSEVPVRHIAKLVIEPSDFYFIHKVTTHQDNESILRTWFFYKLRKKLSAKLTEQQPQEHSSTLP